MTDYELLAAQAEALTDGVPYLVANLANLSALIYDTMPDLNWAGFYLMRSEKLVLGPFQGKPACIEIPLAKGVCGAAARLNKTQLVANVHEFPGHIACDCASNSEVVVPLHRGGRVIGVLDIDSPTVGRFTEADARGLELVAKAIEKCLEGSN